MFVSEVVTSPRYVEGRKFIERTVKSKFNKANVTIRTVFMDDKPLIKEYTFENDSILKNIWKSMRKGYITQDMTLDKKLNVIV